MNHPISKIFNPISISNIKNITELELFIKTISSQDSVYIIKYLELNRVTLLDHLQFTFNKDFKLYFTIFISRLFYMWDEYHDWKALNILLKLSKLGYFKDKNFFFQSSILKTKILSLKLTLNE